MVSWDGIRGTLQWTLALLLIGMITVGAAGLHYWSQKDAFIQKKVADKLQELLPACQSQFSQVQILGGQEIVLTDLVIQSKLTNDLLAKVPRLSIQVDGQLLQQSRRIVVKRIEVDSPEIFALRRFDGTWNWQGIEPIKPKQGYSPRYEIHSGKMQIGMQSRPQGPIHAVETHSVNCSLRPEARQRYRIEGNAVVSDLGSISLTGLIDSNTGEWNIAGDAGAVRVDEKLLERTGEWIPEIQSRLAQLQSSPQYLAHQQRHAQATPFRATANSAASPLLDISGDSGRTQSFMRADVGLQFSIGKQSHSDPLDYEVHAKIENGQLSDLFLPIPLYDVQAQVHFTPNLIQIQEFQAANNESSLFVDGTAHNTSAGWAQQFVVKATHLQIDERIQTVLPPALMKVYRQINPSGTFDLDFDISQQAGQSWAGKLRTFTAQNCRIVHELFQYPVDQIHGQMTHQGSQFFVNMQGIAKGRPVTLDGSFGDGSINKHATFKVSVEDLPIDDQFINAFAQQDQQGAKEVIESLRLRGLIDLAGTFIKNDQTEDSFKMQLAAQVKNGNANFIGFPYELEGFKGEVMFDGLAAKVWKFQNLEARHGHAHFSGAGAFDATTSPGQLGLNLKAVLVPINEELEKASLTSAPHISPIWTDFELGGTIDVGEIMIGWSPGATTEVQLHGIQWKDGSIRPAAFPYHWDNIVGSLDWNGKQLVINSLNGWHGETYLDVNGTDPEWPTFVEVPPEGDIAWKLHFGNLRVVKAQYDEELEHALPEPLSSTLKAMDLQGDVNLQLHLDMAGWAGDEEIVTAKWQMLGTLNENSLFVGIPLEAVSGQVRITQGEWNGKRLHMEGFCRLDEASALEFPFTNIRSPFHLDGNLLTVGSPKFINPPAQYQQPNDFVDKQLRAEIYDGQIGFDAVVLLADRAELTQYKAELNINDIDLAKWAADQFQTAERLSGKVNGLAGFEGMGPSINAIRGNGWINVSPAEIMELPAFAQLFSVINFRPVGDTAFRYGYGDFDIRNGQFDFSRIELRGDALGLIGKGFVGFANGPRSPIKMTFDSRANNRVPLIGPILQKLGNNWIRVQVFGTVNAPEARIEPRIGPLDDAFSEFTDAFENGQRLRPPNTRIGR